MANILIVEDDPRLRASFEKLLIQEGHLVDTASSGEAGVEAVRRRVPDCMIMDVRLPGMDGLAAYRKVREIEPRLPVIIMTAFGTTDTAIQATKAGAFDYVLKPFDIPAMLALIGQALKAGHMMKQVRVGAEPGEDSAEAIIGESPPMQELYKAIGRVAPTDATVLIRGESGTGKELVARALYQHSDRNEKPFSVINCVAIPETLLESELFGYERGAFTGAAARRVGKIERAVHGTVFLDEIGDMPFPIQAKILRLLQEKNIERLGGREPVPVDVRILAATNRNLEEGVNEGRFREDLYYRLNVVTLRIPPLRERGRDAALLADHFLQGFSREMKVANPGIDDSGRAALLRHTWPGNVRELANAVQKALIFSRGLPLREADIRRAFSEGQEGESLRRGGLGNFEETARAWIREKISGENAEGLFESLTEQFGSLVIQEALSATQGNRSQAARLLGISRPTLLGKIEKHGLKTLFQVSSAD